MKVRQISVFLENRSGRLASVLKEVGRAGVNIRALSLADTSDFGILRLIVDDVDTCVKALRDTGHTVSTTEVLAVEVPDHPGGLAGILDVLSRASLNVEYMYAFVSRATEKALVVFRFEKIDAALAALQKAGISIVAAETVYTL
ncbi:MAG: ACT domain-containing protein [Kiritimatiellia bacterium]